MKPKAPTKEDRKMAFRHLRIEAKPIGPEVKWLKTGEGYVVDSLMALADLVMRARLLGKTEGHGAGYKEGYKAGSKVATNVAVAVCARVEEDCAKVMRKALNDETVIDWGHRRKTARRCREDIEAEAKKAE